MLECWSCTGASTWASYEGSLDHPGPSSHTLAARLIVVVHEPYWLKELAKNWATHREGRDKETLSIR